jgi:plasmid stabilization system protein ParE
MTDYVLRPTAQEDLTDIRDHYWDRVGYGLARQVLVEFVEAFRFSSRNPFDGPNGLFSLAC